MYEILPHLSEMAFQQQDSYSCLNYLLALADTFTRESQNIKITHNSKCKYLLSIRGVSFTRESKRHAWTGHKAREWAVFRLLLDNFRQSQLLSRVKARKPLRANKKSFIAIGLLSRVKDGPLAQLTLMDQCQIECAVSLARGNWRVKGLICNNHSANAF